MNPLREAAQQALEFFDAEFGWSPGEAPRIDALRAALAQQAEPVPGAWVASPDGRVIYDDVSADDGLLRVSGDFENDEQRSRYAQRIVDKLNAAPPQRQPLTEEEIIHIGMTHQSLRQVARAVERAHGIKEN